MLPLCLGIDPGNHAGIALVEPGERPRLLVLRAIPAGLSRNDWASRAFYAMEAIARAAQGRPVVGWYELTAPPPGNGWMGNNALSMRRGQLIAHASDAGIDIDRIEHVMPQTWASILGVPRGKRGDGSHRIPEAERLVEMDPRTLRGLGDSTVDAAEAVLIAAARAWRLLGIKAPKAPKARKPRKGAALAANNQTGLVAP